MFMFINYLSKLAKVHFTPNVVTIRRVISIFNFGTFTLTYAIKSVVLSKNLMTMQWNWKWILLSVLLITTNMAPSFETRSTHNNDKGINNL